jgi:hypothetical protein
MPSTGSWYFRDSATTSSNRAQSGSPARGSLAGKIALSSTSTRMNRAPIALASAKMRSFMASGVQHV